MSTSKKFSADKLLENAVTSIRLGVEDFKTCQAPGGDDGRALSAARNLFAGILLLFKYRITQKAKNEEEGGKLIFKTTEPQPKVDGAGVVVWEPEKIKTSTIDVNDIQIRFATLKIQTNWSVVKKLQDERNDLEHLYSTAGTGAAAKFVAECFPILKDFCINELESEPFELLGNAWTAMLGHHDFYLEQQNFCQETWDDTCLPFEMPKVVKAALCPACGSSLLKLVEPLGDADDWEHGTQGYACEACGNQGDAMELLEETLSEMEGGYNPFDFGDEPPTAECPSCGHGTYVYSKTRCMWCGSKPKYTGCAVCGEGISLDEQELGGLCSYHHHQANKDD